MSGTAVTLEGSIFKQRDGGALERRGKRQQLAVLDPGKLDGVDMRSDPPSPEDRVNLCVLGTVWRFSLRACSTPAYR